MRLIDADALMQFPIRLNHYDRVNGSEDYVFGVEAVLEYAENLPTIDAEPVRHGRWIEDGPDWVCSYCGTEFKDDIEFIKLDYDYHMPHYCPHCGAKMDLEVQDD